jgi:probable HAF family extracellular repeat protein
MNKRTDRMKKWALTPVAMLLFATMASAQSYYVVNIGVLPGQTDSIAKGINSSGTVVGSSGNRAFVFQGCSMTEVGHLVTGQASAAAISNQGMIVGTATSATPGQHRAFSYEGGVISDLGGSSLLSTSATAISSWQIPVGVVAGPPSIPTIPQAVYYLYGQVHALPGVSANPPFVQNVTGVNDLLQVTGFVVDSGLNAIGFVSAPSFGTWTRIHGIPGNADQNAVPYAINNDGHIVGGAGARPHHAFFSTNPNAPAVDLGTLGDPGNLSLVSEAMGINIHNWVVGTSDTSPTAGRHAFVHNGSTMIDLNTRLVNGAGWILEFATGINDNGLIIGNGTFNGFPRAFLLIPVGYPYDTSRCNVTKGPGL